MKKCHSFIPTILSTGIRARIINTCNLSRCSHYSTWAIKNKIVDKAKSFARDGFYVIIVTGTIVAMGTVFYSLGNSLWTEHEIQLVYDRTVERILADRDIVNALGDPVNVYRDIKGVSKRLPFYNIVQHSQGTRRLSMQFYLIGSKYHAIVDAEFDQDESSWKDHLVLVTSPSTKFSKYLAKPHITLEETRPIFKWLFGRYSNENKNHK